MRNGLKVFLAFTLSYFLLVILVTFGLEVFSPKRLIIRVNSNENGYVNRSAIDCNRRLNWGEMCPALYTELGGKCELMNSMIFCPDIRRKSNYITRQGQLVITRMLRIFHLLAEKHGLLYWLTSGTLLGAARHKGFIPWDMDADVEMPLEDYVKFFQYAARDLPDDIFFQNPISDPPLSPDDPENYDKHPVVGIYERSSNPRLRDKTSCYKYCKQHDCGWHDGLMLDIFVVKAMDSSVFPLRQMEFEGFNFSVPNKWRKILEDKYEKDYMVIPEVGSPDEYPNVSQGCDKLA